MANKMRPIHPGEILSEEYLKPLGITQQALATSLGISRRRVNELIRGHRGITADTAVRLARYFGNEATFWMQLQCDWDLHEAARRLKLSRSTLYSKIRRYGLEKLAASREKSGEVVFQT